MDPTLFSDIRLNYTVDGTPLSVTFAALDQFVNTRAQKCLIQGIGIGCGVILAFVSWFSITNRKTPVFVLNQICLAFLVVRCVLFMVFLTSLMSSVTYAFTGASENFQSDFSVTIAVSVIYVLLIAAIECLFVFQVYVMFKSCKNRLYFYAMLAFSSALALCVFIMYVIETVFNLRDTWDDFMAIPKATHWRNNLPFLLFCTSINVLSILLVGKLIMAIRTRRVLGLKQFNALHILLIMTLQTCIIPSAMVIYNYCLSESSPVFVNLSVIVIVCNLPFSSLWASTANNTSTPNSCNNSVFSRVPSRESNETLAFSFRSRASAKEMAGHSKEYMDKSGASDGDDTTIGRILQEIEMELRIRST